MICLSFVECTRKAVSISLFLQRGLGYGDDERHW